MAVMKKTDLASLKNSAIVQNNSVKVAMGQDFKGQSISRKKANPRRFTFKNTANLNGVQENFNLLNNLTQEFLPFDTVQIINSSTSIIHFGIQGDIENGLPVAPSGISNFGIEDFGSYFSQVCLIADGDCPADKVMMTFFNSGTNQTKNLQGIN